MKNASIIKRTAIYSLRGPIALLKAKQIYFYSVAYMYTCGESWRGRRLLHRAVGGAGITEIEGQPASPRAVSSERTYLSVLCITPLNSSPAAPVGGRLRACS